MSKLRPVKVKPALKVCFNICNVEQVPDLCVFMCTTRLKNKTAGDYKLCDFTGLSEKKKQKLRAYIFFNNITLFTWSLWQLHYILGGGMWSCGNVCYVTGLLSGKGEQWLTAPV